MRAAPEKDVASLRRLETFQLLGDRPLTDIQPYLRFQQEPLGIIPPSSSLFYYDVSETSL
jgi:hypothetical protein